MNKKISILLLILTSYLGFAQDFTVHNYSVDIYLNSKGYFDVEENYDLNFENNKHGIYRTIQTNYDLLNYKGEKEKRKIRISNIDVPNYNFEAPFKFEQKLSNSINIKIGDKDITLIGPQHYQIKYRVHNAFLFEDSQIRFYWNIKPEDWHTNFNNINFRIHVPDNIGLGADNCFVYSGETGTDTLSNDFRLQYINDVFSGVSKDNFISKPGQSVTILINLPVNSIKEVKPFWPFWNNYGWVFIIAALIGSFYSVWKKYGKDERVVSTTSYYPPENIDPAMAGFLINDRDDSSDLISLLPHWGAKGLLKIEEIPKKGLFSKGDTKLIKLKSLPTNAAEYEHEIFDGLFNGGYQLSSKGKTIGLLDQILGQDKIDLNEGEILVSSLQESFYTTMAGARSTLKKKAQPYYDAKSEKIKVYTYIILVLMAIALGLLGMFVWGPLATVAIVITCVILIFINTYMIKKNAAGNRLFSELKGFKQFIKMAEENKLKMLLKDDPGYFETTMGYALAFGLFDKWASKFDDLNLPPPNWYNSTNYNTLSMGNFSKSFSNVMSGVKSNMVSSPSSSGSSGGGSSGGGSSGGGFGGGGGGSW